MKWIESLLASSPNICSLKTNFSSLTRTWPSCKMLHNVLFLMQVGTNLTSRMSWRKQIDRLVISRILHYFSSDIIIWERVSSLNAVLNTLPSAVLNTPLFWPGILFWILFFCGLEYCFEYSCFQFSSFRVFNTLLVIRFT